MMKLTPPVVAFGVRYCYSTCPLCPERGFLFFRVSVPVTASVASQVVSQGRRVFCGLVLNVLEACKEVAD